LLINLQFLPYPSESIIHQPFYIRRHTWISVGLQRRQVK
jgi:hypothetical protein